MILELFAFFVAISLVLIIIGLARPTESAQALIGFFFLFLLSFTIMGDNLEYQSGEIRNTTYSYLAVNGSIDYTIETITYTYDTWDDQTGLFNTHRFGYFLAVISFIGFVGVMMSLKGGWRE